MAIEISNTTTWSEDMKNASIDTIHDSQLQEQVLSGIPEGWSQEMRDASLATIHDTKLQKELLDT